MSHAAAAAHAGDGLEVLVEEIKLVADPLAVAPPLFLPGVMHGHFREVGEGATVPAAEPHSLAARLQVAEVKAMAGGAEVRANPAIDTLGRDAFPQIFIGEVFDHSGGYSFQIE